MTRLERLRRVKRLLQKILEIRSEYYPVEVKTILDETEILLKEEYNEEGVCGWGRDPV